MLACLLADTRHCSSSNTGAIRPCFHIIRSSFTNLVLWNFDHPFMRSTTQCGHHIPVPVMCQTDSELSSSSPFDKIEALVISQWISGYPLEILAISSAVSVRYLLLGFSWLSFELPCLHYNCISLDPSPVPIRCGIAALVASIINF